VQEENPLGTNVGLQTGLTLRQISNHQTDAWGQTISKFVFNGEAIEQANSQRQRKSYSAQPELNQTKLIFPK
jgi:hypothetical protein